MPSMRETLLIMKFYYSNTCKCGCGGKMEIKKCHKYLGIPNYIKGHNQTKGNYKHGEAKKGKETKLYVVWKEMIIRCNNLNYKRFADWGGRGITICPEWTNDYIVFRDWALSHGYKDGLEIDRIDNNGNYTPENCHFVTSQENSQNRRTTKLNKEKVMEIREKYKAGNYTTRQLAKEYNLKSKSTIVFLLNNKTWGNI